jgi:hypothetical protein
MTGQRHGDKSVMLYCKHTSNMAAEYRSFIDEFRSKYICTRYLEDSVGTSVNALTFGHIASPGGPFTISIIRHHPTPEIKDGILKPTADESSILEMIITHLSILPFGSALKTWELYSLDFHLVRFETKIFPSFIGVKIESWVYGCDVIECLSAFM